MRPTLWMPHLCPSHMGAEDFNFIRGMQPPHIKIMIQSDDWVPFLKESLDAVPGVVVVRSQPLSENWGNRPYSNKQDAMERARHHAEVYRVLFARCKEQYDWQQIGLDWSRVAVEGMNEPEVWTEGECPELTVTYYNEFMLRMKDLGYRTVALNVGVGWVGNSDTKDLCNTPPNWEPYYPMVKVIKDTNSFLGLHEYCFVNGIRDKWVQVDPDGVTRAYGGWGWWMGRYRACPFDVPIMITEWGMDTHTVPRYDYYGWRGLANNFGGDMRRAAEQYVGWYHDYEDQALADGRIKGISPFLFDYFDRKWATFDTMDDAWKEEFRKFRNGPETPTTLWPLPVYSIPAWRPEMPVPPVSPDMIQVKLVDDSILSLSLTEYLKGVVPSEVFSTWPDEALKAQAILALTYARWRKAHPRGTDFDIYADARDQAYNPSRKNENTDRIVDELGDVYLVDEKGQPAEVHYVAKCGNKECPYCFGRPGSNNQVWPGRACQWGIHDLAQTGTKAEVILRFFFPNLHLNTGSDVTQDNPDVTEALAGISEWKQMLESYRNDINTMLSSLQVKLETDVEKPLKK